ncbi:hypothetical protein NEOLEDRAFT_1141125 [Neolentinus lepideus HHB14362 ss-1]|uniref:Uncharacterized protein n=1 Tax=Neolentinus lepideus HHB14362 ss-1 TaxID=1314782 RepID=A0A165NV97_9AGAM|nr:hypothetical protein NEOLEDRAFT_1141125 [Neolentinus lepideus HHB14362 ss-1]
MVEDQRNDLYDESESLFGSPPPSPGRPRSPGIALPGGSSFADNVGTIALPGSHTHSELPIHPPDSLLSVRSHVACPAPQLQMRCQVPDQRSSSATPGPSTRPRKTKDRGKQKDTSRTVTPRPTPPPIQMPDPRAPPPANFLRNQQALLGLAGLVGGVNPANLKRSSAGSSSKNPIIVEEGHDPPSLAQRTRLPFIDPSVLPTPSTEAILDTMIKQKNIFPVLSSILKLISSAAVPASSIHNRHQHSPSPVPSAENDGPPPAKRKKVMKVPAGASNWDVPFPLENGECSQEYLANWERARTKQLVVQLVNLIKTAANKAATKAYIQKVQKEMPKAQVPAAPRPLNVMGHYRPATLFYGMELEGAQIEGPTVQAVQITQDPALDLQSMLADVSNGNDALRPAPLDDATASVNTANAVAYDRLITSFLSGTTDPVDNATLSLDTFNLDSLPDTPANTDDNAMDIGGWMSLLQSLPQSDSSLNPEGTEAPSVVAEGVHSPSDDVEQVPSARSDATSNAPTPGSQGRLDPDLNIDPFLLALSQAVPSEGPLQDHGSITDSTQLPVLSHSPVASTSSIVGPPTPPGWETCASAEPNILSNVTGDDPLAAATMLLRLASESGAHASSSLPPSAPSQGGTSYLQLSATGLHQQNQSWSAPNPYVSMPHESPANPSTAPVAGPSWIPSRRPSRPAGSSVKKISKEDILRRTKERRTQLMAEIERAKIQLWETTLEQGVLTHLIKDSG